MPVSSDVEKQRDLCDKRFNKIDDKLDDFIKNVSDMSNKLSVLNSNLDNVKNQMGNIDKETRNDHDKLLLVKEETSNNTEKQYETIEKVDRIAQNLIDLSAYQNVMVDKLTELTKAEEKKSNFKSGIISAIIVIIVGAIILLIMNHALSNLLDKKIQLDTTNIKIQEKVETIKNVKGGKTP